MLAYRHVIDDETQLGRRLGPRDAGQIENVAHAVAGALDARDDGHVLAH